MALPTIYADTGGSATNSGSSDNNAADLSGAAASVASTTVTLTTDNPNLSGVPTDGSATIYIADATNSNQKIFKITATDNTAKTVTVDIAPTGSIVASAWAIGGRFVWTSASIEAAIVGGWSVQFNNSPASKSGAAFFTFRAAATTATPINVFGKSGVRPVITITDTSNVFAAGSNDGWKITNLELVQQGASGDVITGLGGGSTVFNVKISDGGGNGIAGTETMTRYQGNEISGVGADGINNSAGVTMFGNYVHDNAGDGVDALSQTATMILDNIFDTNGGQGIEFRSGIAANFANTNSVMGNIIYASGANGMRVNDGDYSVMLYNNIFQNNGNAAGEYNVNWAGGNTAETLGIHGYNCFNTAGGGGSSNLSGLTTNATEITTDPLFVDAANGDFRLQSTSPCKGTGFPGQFLGGPLGYMDMGAVQRQESGGGGLRLAGNGGLAA